MTLNRDSKKTSHLVTHRISIAYCYLFSPLSLAVAPSAWGQAGSATGTVRGTVLDPGAPLFQTLR